MNHGSLVLTWVLLVCLSLAREGAAQSAGILREVWLDIGGGGAVADLTSNPAFPNNPSFEGVLTDYFEAPTDVYDDYGQRLQALITAPTTGNYQFWISSDDASQLYLSTDEDPAKKRLVASVVSWTPPRTWSSESGQQSALIGLTAGKRYYIEALMKEGQGGDNLAVRWQLPGGTMEEPIPASRCVPYGVGPPVITRQPTNTTVAEGGTATFGVELARMTGATFQWRRNGTNLPGATAAACAFGPVGLSQSGNTFVCAITNASGWTNTATATLTVQADTTRPTLVSVRSLGGSQLLMVTFSEPVEAASAGLTNNYSLNNGARVLGVLLPDDPSTVTLQTTPLAPALTYTLRVNNVRDRAQTPNTILPDSQYSFTTSYTPLEIRYVLGTNEPAGPSSRRTGLAITEIMYHPTNRPDGRNLEFVEIYNSSPWAEDLGGHRLTGDAGYTFPAGTTIPAFGYRVIAANPADAQAVYGLTGVLGPLTNSNGNAANVLDNGGGTVRLRDELSSVLLEVNYNDAPPWPASPDGAGHSLVLARPSYGEGDPRAWAASDRVGGSPGAPDTATAHPARTVLINEILAHTDLPQEDFIELFNYGSSPVDLGNYVLTDDPETNKFRLAAGTSIPALGWLAFTETQLGFALSAEGETVYLMASDGSRVVDALQFDAQENGVAYGRYPDGAPRVRRLAGVTLGSPNARPLLSDVVINELHYHPVTENEDEEFVEVYNRGTATLNLAQWRLSGSINFTFPTGASLPAGGYAVVARSLTNFFAAQSNLGPMLVFGNYGGGLGNGGDVVRLDKPDELVSTNQAGQLVTNKTHIVMDTVAYQDGGRWGRWADGGGSSLERTDPRGDGSLAPSWADSDETAKSGWTTVEFTGLLDNGAMANADQLQLFLLGGGECLVDNVEVIPQGGANVVVNGTFDSNANGWFFQGTHQDSSWQSAGGYSGGCVRVVASDRGDTGANRIRTVLSQTLSQGATATLRARVRWLKGHPEILLRLHGNWLEAPGDIVTTRAFGSPAARNTQFRTNAGPAITDVRHWPVLPAPWQAVTVTAQIEDPDGLATATLKYRADPNTNYFTLPLDYRGAGFYSATIPGQAANVRVAFYLEAQDMGTPAATGRFPADAPERECLVGFGEPAGLANLGKYRLWVTQKNVTRWGTREKQSNHPLDATYVYGDCRVCYNAGTLYSGSPWHTPGYSGPSGGACDYELNLAKDDRVLGADDFVLATIGNLHSDPTYQGERTSFWIGRKLGAIYLHRRHVRVFFNSVQRGNVYEDSQQPDREIVRQFFPNDDAGNLHKIEDWFEFNDSGDSKLGNVDATLENFTTAGGVKKTARYRWIWRPRAVRESANDFTNLFALVDAVNAAQPEPYRSRVAGLMDVEEWTRIMAMERIVGNWDSYGYNRGKNMYAYKPENGPWVLLPWDIDFVFDVGGNGPTTSLFGGNAPLMNRLRAFPEFQRAYWRAFEDALNGPLNAATFANQVDARYSGLLAAGVGPSSPQGLKNYAAARRTYILSQLVTVAATFRVDGSTSFSTNRNLITLSGAAPITVATITVNGVAAQPTWTTVTGWTLRLALQPGVNTLVIQGLNNQGQAVSGATASLAVTFTGILEPPSERIVINEIMYNPAVPDADFIELHSTATNTAYDLSNWRLNGLDGTILPGTILQPGGFLVFAKDADVFARTYGIAIPVAGTFEGSFDRGGETIQLIQPGAIPALDVVIDQVTYDDDPPWPAAADGTGSSLQLRDPSRDNNRVGNWVVGSTNILPPQSIPLLAYTNAWKFMQVSNLDGVNWTATNFNDAAWPSGPGLLAFETNSAIIAPLIRTVLNDPRTATNNVVRSHAYYFRTKVVVTNDLTAFTLNASAYVDDGLLIYVNGREAERVRFNDGVVVTNLSLATGTPSGGDATSPDLFTLDPGWFVVGTNVLAVEVHQNVLNSTDITFGLQLTANFAGTSNSYALATPGAVNSVRTTLPPFPTLWLNELLPANSPGLTNALADRMGDFDPWVELFNAGTNVINLTGFYLTTNYASPVLWPFPATAVIQPGQFLVVWLDGEPGESTSTEWHTGFRLKPGAGTLALTYTASGQTNVLDYLNYDVATVGRSYGSYPNANVSSRRLFSIPTPGASNNPASLPIQVFINEWMADNSGTEADPADGNYEDWFEIYNPGGAPVDLGGYYFTDNLTNKFQCRVPDNGQYVVPPGGHLLVWADNESGQNDTNRADLHVSFALSKGGDAIGLFGADGAVVDAVTFGPQTTDASEGRFPDGGANVVRLAEASPRAPNLVSQENRPPVLDALPNRTVGEGTLLTFTATATDPNIPAQLLTFSLDPGAPSGANLTAGGVFTWIPTEEQGPGVYPVTARVTDSGLPPLSDTRSFTVQVNEANAPPVLSPLSSVTISEMETYTVTATATDPDLPPQHLTFSLDSGAPFGSSINATNGVITWQPTETQGPGTYFVTVRVIDDGEPMATTTQPLTLTVREVNRPPQFAPQAEVALLAGRTLTVTNVASDADRPAQILTLNLLSAPSGALFDAVTGRFTWRPTIAQTDSTNWVSVAATDDGSPALSATQDWQIVVLRPAGPVLSNPRVADGRIEFLVSGDAGPDYVIERAADASSATWLPLATNASPGLPFVWSDPGSTNALQGLYRVRLVP